MTMTCASRFGALYGADGLQRLLQKVRKRLRDNHGFARDRKSPFGVPCVFSTEPSPPPASGCAGRVDVRQRLRHGQLVTGTMGLVAASLRRFQNRGGLIYGRRALDHPARNRRQAMEWGLVLASKALKCH